MGDESEVFDAYTAFKIEPRDDEVNDPNIPKNVKEAIELFRVTNKVAEAERCIDGINSVLETLRKGPDGKTPVLIGMKSCICWDCGFIGLPKNYATIEENSLSGEGVCSFCSLNERTNLVRGEQPDGSMIPWIEAKINFDN